MNALGNNANAQLRSVVERIEKLEEDKKAITEDIKEIYSEAKSNGYDVKALRAIIKMRKQDKDERAEHEAHPRDLHGGPRDAG